METKLVFLGMTDPDLGLEGADASRLEPGEWHGCGRNYFQVIVLGGNALDALDPARFRKDLSGHRCAVLLCPDDGHLSQLQGWLALGFHEVVAPEELPAAIHTAGRKHFSGMARFSMEVADWCRNPPPVCS